MALLDMIRWLPDVRAVVAHVDHGVREDAAEDAKLVRQVAVSHNLPFEMIQLHLGPGVSEEDARRKRYNFLRHISKKYNARAILTAHHRDDVIETAIINILRGTGWRGLSSLRSHGDLVRPLLGVQKAELVEYALSHGLRWRHDSTNDSRTYLRNRIRHELLSRMAADEQNRLYQYIVRQIELTESIEYETSSWLARHVVMVSSTTSLPRYGLIMLPRHVAHELLQEVLRRETGKSLTRPQIAAALLFIKVAKSNKTFPLGAYWQLRSLAREVIVEQRPTVVSLGNAGFQKGTNYVNKGRTHFETETTK